MDIELLALGENDEVGEELLVIKEACVAVVAILVPEILMQELVVGVVDGESLPIGSSLMESDLNFVLVRCCFWLLGDADVILLELLAPWLVHWHVSIEVEGIYVWLVVHVGNFPDGTDAFFANLVSEFGGFQNKFWTNDEVLELELV